MAVKSVNFQLEDDQITVTLSNSARISLSDITAATIGNLSEDSQWANDSVSTADAGQSVLRPWEDNSIVQTEVSELHINLVTIYLVSSTVCGTQKPRIPPFHGGTI